MSLEAVWGRNEKKDSIISIFPSRQNCSLTQRALVIIFSMNKTMLQGFTYMFYVVIGLFTL